MAKFNGIELEIHNGGILAYSHDDVALELHEGDDYIISDNPNEKGVIVLKHDGLYKIAFAENINVQFNDTCIESFNHAVITLTAIVGGRVFPQIGEVTRTNNDGDIGEKNPASTAFARAYDKAVCNAIGLPTQRIRLLGEISQTQGKAVTHTAVTSQAEQKTKVHINHDVLDECPDRDDEEQDSTSVETKNVESSDTAQTHTAENKVEPDKSANTAKPNSNSDEYRLTFGTYKGKTVSEALSGFGDDALGYFHWAVGKVDFLKKNDDFKKSVIAFYDGKETTEAQKKLLSDFQ